MNSEKNNLNKQEPLVAENVPFLTKRAFALIGIGIALTALLLAISLWLGTYALQTSADKATAKIVGQKAATVEEIDLANTLREDTVNYVFDKEAIPAYSYDEIWEMDMSKPSGVTVADLKLVSRGAFVGLEKDFWQAEQDNDVNCLFVMGIASLESANGTICFRPNNMFGFGGSGFSSKSECISVVAKALANNYLSTSGSLYNGKQITDVNKRYAASSTWDEKVCRNMVRYYATISANHNKQLEKLKQ